MSRDEQIIDIKECIDSVYGADCAYFNVDGFAIANEIYNAGYRKSSEIFEELETSLHYKVISDEIHFIIRAEDYLHYKKKYTETKEGEG